MDSRKWAMIKNSQADFGCLPECQFQDLTEWIFFRGGIHRYHQTSRTARSYRSASANSSSVLLSIACASSDSNAIESDILRTPRSISLGTLLNFVRKAVITIFLPNSAFPSCFSDCFSFIKNRFNHFLFLSF